MGRWDLCDGAAIDTAPIAELVERPPAARSREEVESVLLASLKSSDFLEQARSPSLARGAPT